MEKVEQKTATPSVMSRLLDIIWVVLMLGMITYLLLLKTTVVQGNSMRPTYETGDRLVVLKYNTGLAHLNYDDKVVFFNEKLEAHIIKRLIGLPGDTIEINGNQVIRNGELLLEDYLYEAEWNTSHEQDQVVTVPDGYLYVMGDNRNHSDDSRFSTIGLVSIEEDLVGPVRLDLN